MSSTISLLFLGTFCLTFVGIVNSLNPPRDPVHNSLLQNTNRSSTRSRLESSPESNPSSQLGNTYSDHRRKKRAVERDTMELTEEDCFDNETFYSSNGKFQVYILEALKNVNDEIENDENETVTFKCIIDPSMPQNCKGLVIPTLASASLVINEVLQDGEKRLPTRYLVPHNDTQSPEKYFDLILHYESHLDANLYCVTDLTNKVKLVSDDFQIPEIDELFEVTLTPESTEVKIGSSYNLTCSLGSVEAFKYLRWTRKTKFQSDVEEIECEERPEVSCSESEAPPRNIMTVKTNETDDFKGETYFYYCGTRYTGHANQPTAEARVTVQMIDRSWRTIVGAVGGVLFAGTVILVIIRTIIRRRKRARLTTSIRMTETRNEIMQIARQTSNENDRDRRATDAFMMAIETVNSIMDRISKKHSAWEKDKSKIQIKAQIGEGNFGVVLSGTMPNEFGIIQTVAIKTIKEQGIEVSALLDFEKEMEVMVTLKHRNIVNLLGICTVSLPFYIIMEYMENGQLNNYLTKFAPSRDKPLGGLPVGQLAWMCQQPCDALEYLAANNMVHRDVSARNCLVSYNLQVKLADFGLSRDTSVNDKNYYKKEGGMVPIKWMAPEALTYGRYTTANDVWAFGILAWEVFSFGALPYQHLTNQQVMVNICKGERLERPHLCPEGLWEVLLECWADKPDERIMFTALLAFFKEYSEETPVFPNEGVETEFSIPHANTTVAY